MNARWLRRTAEIVALGILFAIVVTEIELAAGFDLLDAPFFHSPPLAMALAVAGPCQPAKASAAHGDSDWHGGGCARLRHRRAAVRCPVRAAADAGGFLEGQCGAAAGAHHDSRPTSFGGS